MRTTPTFCYVLVGTEQNPLCEACFVSASLLRRLYPESRIVLVCDFATESVLAGKDLSFVEPGVEVVSIDVPEIFEDNAVRSRFIKTSFRMLLDGDLVFLDCDALPFQRFDELFNHSHSFAAVLDRNAEFVRPYMPEWVEPIYKHFDWKYPLTRYFNSGVMFMRDNAEMQELGMMWHENWHDVLDKFQKHQDQPTLNATLNELKIDTKTMDIRFNAMVDSSILFARNAKIVHYFFNGRRNTFDPESLLQNLVEELKLEGRIDWSRYENQISRGDAWVHPTQSVFKELVCRNYGHAAKVAMTRIQQKVWR